MLLRYENELGMLEMSGDASCDIRICKLSGTELLERDRNVIKFLNYDGQTETNSAYPARTITIAGDVFGNPSQKARSAMKILSRSGILSIIDGDDIKQIGVNNAKIAFSDKNSSYWQFTLQLVCDYPHFLAKNFSEIPVCKRTDLITDSTILPAVFTERISSSEISNDGDVLCEPVFLIRGGAPAEGEGSIEIEVNSKKLVLDYTLSEGELVTVDIPQRSITSDINGNILSFLAQNSYLYDMLLPVGENSIKVIANDANADACVSLRYRKNYLTI
ncbi:MAG: phage tail family protein [Firmicutes bacterium]|nr:phage tail family protein [Bacillota bacterium]